MKSIDDIELIEIVRKMKEVKHAILADSNIKKAAEESNMSEDSIKSMSVDERLYFVNRFCNLDMYKTYRDLKIAHDYKSQMLAVRRVEDMFD